MPKKIRVRNFGYPHASFIKSQRLTTTSYEEAEIPGLMKTIRTRPGNYWVTGNKRLFLVVCVTGNRGQPEHVKDDGVSNKAVI